MTIKFTRRSVCALGAAALGCAAFPPFAAEDPIRIIVPYPPGGPLDVTARAVAEEARHDLGNIIVKNKPGAGGNIGVDYVCLLYTSDAADEEDSGIFGGRGDI